MESASDQRQFDKGSNSGSGPWMIPRQIELGVIQTEEAVFLLELAVPARCRLATRVSGIEFEPSTIEAGIHTVRMKVSDHPRDTILWGGVELRTDEEVRVAPLHGRFAATRVSDPTSEISLHRLSPEQQAEFLQALVQASQALAQASQALAQASQARDAEGEAEAPVEYREPSANESPAAEEEKK